MNNSLLEYSWHKNVVINNSLCSAADELLSDVQNINSQDEAPYVNIIAEILDSLKRLLPVYVADVLGSTSIEKALVDYLEYQHTLKQNQRHWTQSSKPKSKTV